MARKKKVIAPPEHCSTVRQYEQSPWWIAKSKELLDDKSCKCQICGRSRWKWQPRAKKWKRQHRSSVHHIKYNNVGHEKEEDLMVLCWQCHDLMHLLLRLESWGGVYTELAKVVRTVFFYDGIKTFHPW